MTDLRVDFFEKLKALFPAAQDAYNDATKDDVEGDEILWVVVYMNVGAKIGEDFTQIPKHKLGPLISLIEDGTKSKDENLSTAVLTGLLETMTDPLMKNRDVWKKAQNMLGKNSVQHMLAMNEFYGIK